MYNVTPGVGSFFSDLWTSLLGIAEEDISTHDRLIGFIAGVKKSDVGSMWKVRGQAGGWGSLLLLKATMEDEWSGP